MLKLGAPKNRKLRIFCPREMFILFCTKTQFLAEIMQLGIFLIHKAIPGTFPSLPKVALGKQGIYLLLSIGVTRNLSQKNTNFPLFFGILGQFSSLYMDILLVKPIFFRKLGLCTTRLK